MGALIEGRKGSHGGVWNTEEQGNNSSGDFVKFLLLTQFLFIYFSWRLIALQYSSVFCHTLTWISHGFTCVPHPELPSHLPPNPIPLGHPSAPALSTLSHASNLDWQSISHMIIYMFQCYSLKSSHPCLLPQSPKVCSLYLCLFCCLAYRVIIPVPVQLLSCVRLFATPWITAHQASLSITNSQNLPKPMSTWEESVFFCIWMECPEDINELHLI